MNGATVGAHHFGGVVIRIGDRLGDSALFWFSENDG